MKYVYCLARDVAAGADTFPPGLNGAEVYHISFERISALISDVDSAGTRHTAPLVSEQNALVHQAVVDAALKLSASVIPCRFGTLFPDHENILTLLRKHYTRLDDHLMKLAGKIEVSVQTILKRRADLESVSEAAHSGTREQEDAGVSYLLGKKEKYDAIKELEEEADRFSQELNQAMSPFWSDVKVQKRSTDDRLVLGVCYLVDQQELSSFKSAYQRFKRENPGLKLLYTGPWAPYTFADIEFRA